MPIRSPEDVPVGTIQDLGLPGRAVNALTRAGVTSVEDLAVLTRQDLAAINGLGPGMIAAIRLVVPEPARSAPRAVAPEEESPDAPAVPSFDSLRSPRRRSAIDLLVPEPAPAPAAEPVPAPAATAPDPAGVPRPAEYTDLLRLGVRAVRAVAGASGRVALWSLRAPVRCLHRLLGQ